jgi:hypothetical protein
VFKELAEKLIPYSDIRPTISNEDPRALVMEGVGR